MWSLFCKKCGFEGEENKYYPYCPVCKSSLYIKGIPPKFRSILGEGNTPIVKESINKNDVYFKLEYLNPTGSFKDRGVSYSLQLASQLKYKCSVEDSSGNTGISTAAFSSRLGIKSKIVIPKYAPPGKKSILRSLGAEVIESETRDEASNIAEELSKECFYVSHARNPFFIEGMKSIAEEIKHINPRGIVVPTSSFSLFLGTYYGLKEIGINAKMFAVQGKETASLREFIEPIYESKGKESKLADGLALKKAPRVYDALSVIKESNGGLLVIDDEEIKLGLKKLWNLGYMVEPTSAVSYIALIKLNELNYDINKYVAMLTGNGLKFYDLIEKIISKI
ncbi:PLP-dependent lyase/thiolase [Caldisphaera sp.]|uniref:PLP-dependent lyase/thiolase n=1 Tax=Caldisphaera sp. TaxID=2060322 RepID=UPI0025C134E3|nr:pyridoxal-phosphate dependent enzyme [Caldisphaera sp.]